METMFDDLIPDYRFPLTEAQKKDVLISVRKKALDILRYNHDNNTSCFECVKRAMVIDLNEVVDILWPNEANKRAGFSYDGPTDTYSIQFENCE